MVPDSRPTSVVLPARRDRDVEIARRSHLRKIGSDTDRLLPLLHQPCGIEQQAPDLDDRAIGRHEVLERAIVDRPLGHAHGRILYLDAGEAGPVLPHLLPILAEAIDPGGAERAILLRPVSWIVEPEDLQDGGAIDRPGA